MEPENPSPLPEPPIPDSSLSIEPPALPPDPPATPPEPHWLRRVFFGDQGLRAGWSVTIFIGLLIVFVFALGTLFAKLHLTRKGAFSARTTFFGELGVFIAMLAAAWIMTKIEHRRLLDYNLRGNGRFARFVAGMVAGLAALSLLVGALEWGGWLHFGPVALSGSRILLYAAVWAGAFLLVGCVEEGTARCYLLFTLARGINFWWAIGLIGAMCGDLLIQGKGQGVWGVYLMALLGIGPCAWLFLRKIQGAGFWYAAWVTSTFFGFGHTGNTGETWIGIFAAAAIGFVFCVSVRVTGSAWWAIGCHAAWDWAETYFYGTADSGMVAKGHYLTTAPAGPAFWSGGTDGPEGSVLVLGVIFLLLIAMLLLYLRRDGATALSAEGLQQAAG